MARFRPSRLFRLSSRDGDKADSKSDAPASRSSSARSREPATPPPASSAERRLRFNSGGSFKALRRRFVEHSVGVPTPVQEQRESVVLLSGPPRLAQEDAGDVGSERTWDTGVKQKEFAGEGEKAAEVSTEELVLGGVDEEQRPVLTVEEPTPELPEDAASEQGPRLESGPSTEPTTDGHTTASTSTPETPSPTHTQPDPKPELEDFKRASHDSARSVIAKTPAKARRPVETNVRKQSLVNSANARIVKTLVDPSSSTTRPFYSSGNSAPAGGVEHLAPSDPFQDMTAMLHRKIWVKRPNASATLVQIREDDLVDDVRDMILRKYANSLGRTFDAPDMTLHIATRADHGAHRQERLLGPEEEMCRTIDIYYPGGQNVDEALIISTPSAQRRTPRPSPQPGPASYYQAVEGYRPLENGSDYFPPMPVAVPATVPQTAGSHESRSSHHHHQSSSGGQVEHPRSISVLSTGQVPPLPSPGAQARRHGHRPKYQRQHTSSPTIVSHPTTGNSMPVAAPPVVHPQAHLMHRQPGRPRRDSTASETHPANAALQPPPPLPTPPVAEAAPTTTSTPPTTSSVPPQSHPARPARPRKTRRSTPDAKAKARLTEEAGKANISLANTMLDGSVPPINVLIVEDNIINLRILEGLMKRLKVRWQTAMNGQIAVDKWKSGGFHLVLMDIQMPVMSGLEATKEIRRLERANGIGVFSSAATGDSESKDPERGEGAEEAGAAQDPEKDKIGAPTGHFKSPVIIVALTASSLQSDRHEALAAGCNDFLTKPVNFVWLERKVKEWGCMQALIDFDGWRRWRDYADKEEEGKSAEEKEKERVKAEKDRVKAEKMAKLQEKQEKAKAEREREKEREREVKRIAEEGESGDGDGA